MVVNLLADNERGVSLVSPQCKERSLLSRGHEVRWKNTGTTVARAEFQYFFYFYNTMQSRIAEYLKVCRRNRIISIRGLCVHCSSNELHKAGPCNRFFYSENPNGHICVPCRRIIILKTYYFFPIFSKTRFLFISASTCNG